MTVVTVAAQLFRDDRVTSTAIRVYGILREDPTLSEKQLETMTKRSARTIADSLEVLQQLGYIGMVQKRMFGQDTRYYEFPSEIPPIEELGKAS